MYNLYDCVKRGSRHYRFVWLIDDPRDISGVAFPLVEYKKVSNNREIINYLVGRFNEFLAIEREEYSQGRKAGV